MKELLLKYNYRLITDYSPNQQKKLLSCLGADNLFELTIFVKVTEQLFEFSDNINRPLWNTKMSLASFVILNGSELFDKFIVPIRPFRIRTAYEIDALMSLYEQLEIELSEFDQFILEKEGDIYAA